MIADNLCALCGCIAETKKPLFLRLPHINGYFEDCDGFYGLVYWLDWFEVWQYWFEVARKKHRPIYKMHVAAFCAIVHGIW